MVQAKVIGLVIVCIIAIIAGFKVSKNLMTIVVILLLMVIGYIGYNAYSNGKTLNTDKIKAVASSTIDSGKKALEGITEFVKPIFKDKGTINDN